MKKIILMTLPLFLNAQNLELEKLRTDLYSKSGTNVLKKIELSLEFEGKNLKENEKKIIDGVNTVVSGFFYEDIFTELGKNNFKKTLEKFLDKKHKIKIDDIYILSLSGVEKFDLEEFKRFLQSTEAEEKDIKNQVKESVENLEIPTVQSPKVPQNLNPDINKSQLEIPQILSKINDEEPQDNGTINPKLFELSKEIEKTIKEGNYTNGFELEFDGNQSQP